MALLCDCALGVVISCVLVVSTCHMIACVGLLRCHHECTSGSSSSGCQVFIAGSANSATPGTKCSSLAVLLHFGRCFGRQDLCVHTRAPSYVNFSPTPCTQLVTACLLYVRADALRALVSASDAAPFQPFLQSSGDPWSM
eukprot:3534488-Alexandrium_andersonii.AAC.1